MIIILKENKNNKICYSYLIEKLVSILIIKFQFVRNPIVVGEYDALVSYVDPGATGFFVRNGFSSDLILNHRFR